MATPYTVERRMTTTATPERLHPLVADFREWQQWSPWEGLDANLRRTYSDPSAGVGAHYAWEGNRKAGAGTMDVTGDTPQRVDVALAFTRPFPSRSSVELHLTPLGDGAAGTEVVWRLVGKLGTVAGLFAKVKSMDSLLGPDLERGLRQLKQVAEGG